MPPVRVVLDTNVVASAILWNGAPATLLVAARAGRIALFTSPTLLAELEDILGRAKFTAKIAAAMLTPEQIVLRYAALAVPVRPLATPRIAPDPDDDVVIGTALAAGAQAIVTGDKPLLSVGDHRGVLLVTVGDMLASLAGEIAERRRD